MMNKAVIFAGSLVIAVTACKQPPASSEKEKPTPETASVTMTLPAGDVEAGRQAFLDLKCTTCHLVPSEPDFPTPVSANPGPPIDSRLIAHDLSYLATAVVSPSHEIGPEASAAVREHLTGVMSPMGDYSNAMTVRQLIDLNAFLHECSMK
jgi:hypothetical protein